MTDILSEKIPYCSCHNLAEHIRFSLLKYLFYADVIFSKLYDLHEILLPISSFVLFYFFVALGLAAFVYTESMHIAHACIPTYIEI